jgi:hypothetical protein
MGKGLEKSYELGPGKVRDYLTVSDYSKLFQCITAASTIDGCKKDLIMLLYCTVFW